MKVCGICKQNIGISQRWNRAAEKILYMTFQNKRTARQRKYICNKNLKNTGTTVKIDPYEFSLSKRGVVACTLKK